MEVSYFRHTQCCGTAVPYEMRARGNGLPGNNRFDRRQGVHSYAEPVFREQVCLLEAFTDAVRMEMKQYGVRACIIEPGDTKTGFSLLQGKLRGRCRIRQRSGKSVAKMAADEQNGRSPDSVAKVALCSRGKKKPSGESAGRAPRF